MNECPRRETKKRETADKIARTAIRLVQEAGSIDDVSIADIANAAGISRRTFFNHYPTKLSALLDPLFRYRASYTEHIITAPRKQTVWQVICDALLVTIEECHDLTTVAQSEWILSALVHSSSAPADIPHREAQNAHKVALQENLQERLSSDDPIAVGLIMGISDHVLRLSLNAVYNCADDPHVTAISAVKHAYELLGSTQLDLGNDQ